ncbi:MAG: hypothetical protein ACLQBD_01205 [Syntrophobacteraceae bacterium]
MGRDGNNHRFGRFSDLQSQSIFNPFLPVPTRGGDEDPDHYPEENSGKEDHNPSPLPRLPRQVNFNGYAQRKTIAHKGIESGCEISLHSISITGPNRSPRDIQALLRKSLNCRVTSMGTQTVPNDALTNSYSGCFRTPVPNDVNALQTLEVRMVKVDRVEWAPLITCTLNP